MDLVDGAVADQPLGQVALGHLVRRLQLLVPVANLSGQMVLESDAMRLRRVLGTKKTSRYTID